MALLKSFVPTTLSAVAAALLIAASPSAAQRRPADMKAMLRGWPQSAQMAAADMMRKYGPPQEVTPTMLKWRNNGPWKYTMISNYETPHRFPVPHPDVMEQGIDYAVPWNMFDDLAAYDGSVTVDRTQGILAARCDKEGANFLALNLANDIVTKRHSVASARGYYARAIARFKANGQMDRYMQRLHFRPQPNSGFRDSPAPMRR